MAKGVGGAEEGMNNDDAIVGTVMVRSIKRYR